MPAADAIRRLGARGVRAFVYTNVDRDGKLGGPGPRRGAGDRPTVRGRFLYSGGIGQLEDLTRSRSCDR
jgi:phosphoribosylformimino-5-aminoimidazole carboxamide ribotide isomerase